MAPGDLVAQSEKTLRNLQTVVESAGGKIQDITKLNIYVRNRDDYLAHLKTLGMCIDHSLVPIIRLWLYSKLQAFSRTKP